MCCQTFFLRRAGSAVERDTVQGPGAVGAMTERRGLVAVAVTTAEEIAAAAVMTAEEIAHGTETVQPK